MKKLLLIVSCFLYGMLANAQSFTGTGSTLPDIGELCFTLNVSGVGTINNTTYGLESVCIHLTHPQDDELEIVLMAPDGTEVPLAVQNGGSGNNYVNTCFKATAPSSIKYGSAPFNGTYLPEGFLGAVNNGQNADGGWQLCIFDRRNNSNQGDLVSWSLNFSGNPAPVAPSMPSCATTLPSNVNCASATPVCDFSGLCGSTSGSTILTWPQLTSAACFTFENNTFLKFIASSSTAEFAVWVPASTTVNSTRGGIQMLAFSGTCGGAVTPYGCFEHIFPSNTALPLANNVRIEGLTPGDEYYLMIDGFGGAIATFTIEALSGINVLQLSPDASVCNGASTTLNASGGNGNFTWSPSAGLNTTTGSSVIANPSSSTTYTVTSTNSIGCALSEDVTVTVNDPPVVTTQPLATTQNICQGNPVTPLSVIASPGSGTITTYQWYLTSVSNNSGGLAIPGANADTYTPNSGSLGTLYFYCLITNSNGCSIKSNISGAVTISAKPSAPVGSVTLPSTCIIPTGTIVLTAPIGVNIEYSVGGAYQSSGIFTGLAPGTYTATARNSVTGCVSAGTPITMNSIPPGPSTATATVTVQPTCAAPTGTIVITSPLGITLSYSVGGAYQASTTFSGLTNGTTYNVYVRNNITSCISIPLSLTVNTIPGAPAAPAASVTTQTDCFNATGTITITAPTGVNYEYSVGGAYQAGLVFNGLTPATNYAVTVRDNLTGCVSAPANLNTNAIVPPSAPAVTSPVTYCQNITATQLSAIGTNLLWYTTSTGGVGLSTAPTPVTSSAGSTNYYVSQTTGSCESNRSAITVDVIAQAPVPTVTPTVSYCQNQGTTQLTATGTNLLWYSTLSGGTGSSTAPTPSSASAGTTVYYVSQTLGGCESARVSITVTVSATPALPAVTSTYAYCQNGTASILTATGSNLLWYTTLTGGTGSATAPTPSTTAAGTTSYYVSQTVGGCESMRALITVTVNATPALPGVTAAVTYCQNEVAAQLSASGSNLLWYNTSTGGVGNSTAPTPSTTSAGTTTYYVSQTINGCEGPRAAITVTVNTAPALPTVTPTVSYCQNQPTTQLTATGTNLLWYSTLSGGTGSSTAPTPSSSSAGTTVYYVSQTLGGCESARASITVTVSATPALPAVTSTYSYCQNGTASILTATGSNLLWYTTLTGGTGSATAPTPSTTSAGTTSYYVSQTVGGCESMRALIAVTVNATPALPGVTAVVTYCQNEVAAQLSASGSNLLWYNTSTGGVGNSTAPTPSTISAGTTTYYVSQTINGCEGPRAAITVTVSTAPVLPAVTATVIYCENDIAAPLAATGLNLLWYNTSTGGTGSITAPTPSTASAGTITYYVAQSANGCEGPRASITVTVNAAPTLPAVNASIAYCENETATPLTATGSNLLWYNTASGGTGSSTAPTPATVTPATNNYYVSQTLAGCESQRAIITVTVNPIPAAPGTGNQLYCRNDISGTLTATGTNLLWYTVAVGGTGSTIAPEPLTGSQGNQIFYVSQTINGCESPRASISVTVKPLPLRPTVTSPVTYCQFNTSTALTASGANLLWYDVATGGTSSATAPVPSTATPGNTFYYVSQTVNGCEGPRAGITVTINKDSTAVTNFSYNQSNVCINGTNPGPALPEGFTAGGTFTATPSGLSINASTGDINLKLSKVGTYTITYSFPSGGCIHGGSSNTSLQIDPAIPTYTGFSYSSPVCKNAPVLMPATVNNFTTGGLFSSSPGIAINGVTGAVNVSASSPGTYQINYRIPTLGCRAATSGTSYVVINDTVGAKTNFTFTPSVVCITSSTNPVFTPVSGFTTGGSFSSSPGGLNLNSNTGAINIGLSVPGVYTIKYSVPQVQCRLAGIDSTIFTISAYGNPVTGFTYFSPVCKRDDVEIPELNMGFTSGGVFSSTTGVTVDSNTGVVDLAKSLPGSYTVKYDVAAGACNPAGSSDVPLTIIAQPEAPSVSPASICGAGEVTLNAAASGTIKWFSEQQLQNQVNVGNSFSSFVENTTNYFVTNTVGSCTSEAAAIAAVINPLPATPYIGSDTAICPNDKLILNPGSYNNYLWQDGSVSSAYTASIAGTYTVVVSTNAGCKDSASITLAFLGNCDDILFPSAFSPNGDGKNDRFGPIGALPVVSNYSMRIFNRYGEVVFSSNNPADRWDGTIRGKKEGNSNYVYVVSYLYKSRITKTKRGSIMIVR